MLCLELPVRMFALQINQTTDFENLTLKNAKSNISKGFERFCRKF